MIVEAEEDQRFIMMIITDLQKAQVFPIKLKELQIKVLENFNFLLLEQKILKIKNFKKDFQEIDPVKILK